MLKIAHRGASAYAEENTLGAFALAMRMGADGVELDVHRCKTGEAVVIHDPTVNRITGGKGRVAGMTLAQLRTLSPAEGERIPTLAQVLKTLEKDAWCLVEIKHKDAALPAAKVIRQHVKRGWNAERLYLISFDHAALKMAQAAFPGLHIGASFRTLKKDSIGQAKRLGAQAIMPHYRSLKPVHLCEAHAQGLLVIPWTVNRVRSIARLKRMGVDGVMGDFPDRLSGESPKRKKKS